MISHPICTHNDLPKKHQKRKRKDTDPSGRLIDLFVHKNLTFSDQKRIQKQLDLTVKYLEIKGDFLKSRSMKFSRSRYIRPITILRALGESTERAKRGRGCKAVYKVSHIHVTRDGRIRIIPKHPKLVLGSGRYKKVRMAIDFDEKIVVAFASIKIVDRAKEMTFIYEAEVIQKYLIEESRVMGRQDHDLATMNIHVIQKQRKIKLICPYANLTDVFEEDYSKEERGRVLSGMTQCLKILKTLGVACNDVKPENFLVFRNPKLLIRIFDLDAAVTKPEECQSREGTGEWFSPEKWAVLTGLKKSFNAYKSDIFSLGICFYQVMNDNGCGKGCDFERSPSYQIELVNKIQSAITIGAIGIYLDNYKRDWEAFRPGNELESLVKSMTHPDPDERPDIDSVADILDTSPSFACT